MNPTGVIAGAGTASLLALGFGFAATSSADPEAPAPATAACRQFAAAVRVSAAYYNTFAYAIAGNGARVDYQDSAVDADNAAGRTALRKAAAEAMAAASTPGLSGEIATPMRSWSWHAAKLVLVMGFRGDGDTLNAAATELDDAAQGAQLACAAAGAQPVVRARR